MRCSSLASTSRPTFPSGPPLGPSFVPSFVPGVPPLPSRPKPPSTNWFNTRPALRDQLDSFNRLIHRSRQCLYDHRLLTRFSAPIDFQGTGIRLKWLKWTLVLQLPSSAPEPSLALDPQRRLWDVVWSPRSQWHPLAQMGFLLGGTHASKLKMMDYNEVVSKLNELKALKRYVLLLKHLGLPSSASHALHLDQLDAQLTQILLRYSRPQVSLQASKQPHLARDPLGRFYGLGKKKQATARVWMIEVLHVPPSTDSVIQPAPCHSETHSASPPPLGRVIINGRPISDYFHTPRQRATALRPLDITQSLAHYNLHVLTHGGGKMGQAAAISHAISRALIKALSESEKLDSTPKERYYKKVLIKSALLNRDPRVVERKKTGKPGAKSSYRWVKR